MLLIDLLSPDRVVADVLVQSKKRALEYLADMLGRDLDEPARRQVFDGLCARERLGTTALGSGVAIPHGRIKAAGEANGALLRLAEPVDFHAADGQPVDLIFGLVVPDHFTDQHLILLAQIAEMFSDPDFCRRLREARNAAALYQLIDDWQAQHSLA